MDAAMVDGTALWVESIWGEVSGEMPVVMRIDEMAGDWVSV
jgi:hypothetical protein